MNLGTNNVDPEKCLFYAKIKDGFIIQHLVAAISHINDQIRIQARPSEFEIQAHHKKTVNGAERMEIILHAFFNGNNFERYCCETPLTLDITAKHFNSHVKDFKRKERIILYIEDTPEPDTLHIVGESTVSDRDLKEEIRNSVAVCVMTRNHPKLYDTDLLECLPDGSEIYGKNVTVRSSCYDRVKKLGKGDLDIAVQDDRYIQFRKTNKSMYSAGIKIGQPIATMPIYQGTFNSNIFNIVTTLSKIKTELFFYAPKYQDYPIKIVVPLTMIGECTIFVYPNEHEK